MNKTIAFLLPTKGRPENLKRFFESYDTNTSGNSVVVTLIDKEEKDLYSHPGAVYVDGSPKLTEKINYYQKLNLPFEYIGFFADDLIIQTKDFDKKIQIAFEENPHINIIYWSDKLNEEKIANHWVIRKEVVDRVGFLALPVCKHMFIDNFWTKVGKETNTIMFLSDVVIEHRHWVGRKAEVDDTYKIASNSEVMEHDKKAYEEFINSDKYKEFLKNYLNE